MEYSSSRFKKLLAILLILAVITPAWYLFLSASTAEAMPDEPSPSVENDTIAPANPQQGIAEQAHLSRHSSFQLSMKRLVPLLPLLPFVFFLVSFFASLRDSKRRKIIKYAALSLALIGWGVVWYALTMRVRGGDGSFFVFLIFSLIVTPIPTLTSAGKRKYIAFAVTLLLIGFLSFLAWFSLTSWL